jgi:hypothetical protein
VGWHQPRRSVDAYLYRQGSGLHRGSRALAAFTAHGNEAGIERRRVELASVIAEQERRQARRMHDPAVLAAAHTEAEALMTFHEREQLARLRAEKAVLFRAA